MVMLNKISESESNCSDIFSATIRMMYHYKHVSDKLHLISHS